MGLEAASVGFVAEFAGRVEGSTGWGEEFVGRVEGDTGFREEAVDVEGEREGESCETPETEELDG